MLYLLLYTISIATVLWYTLFYLPFAELTHNFGFALNIVQWGIVSLLSFLVWRQETHYRSVFIQFWIFFAILALAAPVTYHFLHWSDGNGGVYTYARMLMLIHVLQCWIVVNIFITYAFRDEKRWAVNALTAVVVLPACAWLFWPYYLDPAQLIVQSATGQLSVNYRPIKTSIIWVNGLSIAVLLAFFLHKLRTDKPIGAYADTLLFLFGLMLAIDTAEYVSAITDVQLLNLTQWGLSLVAASMIVTLLLRLKFKSLTIADYYESQCLSDSPDIDRRIGYFDRLILRSFFDPEKVGQKVFLGTGRKKMKVKRTPTRVSKPMRARG